ncbi:MAG TPA: hypothetical protein VK712_04095 [Verrucomicrobiae bacterium]|jgi:hypothetical protein|nr:hypothetical protein [Verrucomicrobiae bacterium]
MNRTGEKVFGDLTVEQVVAGLRSETAGANARRFMAELDTTTSSPPEMRLAMHGLMQSIAQIDLIAGGELTVARLQEARLQREAIAEQTMAAAA